MIFLVILILLLTIILILTIAKNLGLKGTKIYILVTYTFILSLSILNT